MTRKKFQKIQDQEFGNLDEEYKASKRYRDAGEGIMSEEEYQERAQQIHWDIAWEIFDHINKKNDTERYIDLGALDLEDAIAITKQKIYDLAQIALK